MSKRRAIGGVEQKLNSNSMPCQSKVGAKTKSDDFEDTLPRKRWSYHSFSAKSLADICKKEGLVPLSPYPLQPKQSRSDNCKFNKILGRDKHKTFSMDTECEVSAADQDCGGFLPRMEPSIFNFSQFRIRRLQRQPYDNFNVLPDEMILRIFKWLPKTSLGRVSQTCKRLKKIAEDETLWRRVDLQGKILNARHLGIVLSRQPAFLRLARAQVREPVGIPAGFKASQLTYLDLSMSVLSNETLAEILRLCSSLVKLSLEHLFVPKEAVQAMHTFASSLNTLNVTMCYDLDSVEFAAFLKKCRNLRNLNMGCLSQDWSPDKLLEVVSSFSPKIEQLNIAGFRHTLTDTHVEVIVSRCPRLIDLDLSDCQEITKAAVNSITTLTQLQHLALSRCYKIEPVVYGLLPSMRSLRFLEVFSLFQENSMKNLKETIPGVEINQFYFSAVARPTVGLRRSTIWGERVRD